jgi:hypothetical protein
MKFVGFIDMCPPAYTYLVISTMALTVMFLQNYYVMENRFGGPDHNVYCLGSYSCNVPSVTMLFTIKILYVLFWTWVLNLICRAGAPGISWFLVLLPFLLAFVLLASMFFQRNV